MASSLSIQIYCRTNSMDRKKCVTFTKDQLNLAIQICNLSTKEERRAELAKVPADEQSTILYLIEYEWSARQRARVRREAKRIKEGK